MQLVVPSNDEKRSAHLERLVRQIRNDKKRGEEPLPKPMVDQLHALHGVFRKQITKLGKASGRKMSAVKRRNDTTRELCYLVRDVYVMAHRKFDRGKIGPDVLALHGIPKGPIRANERKTGEWVVRAEFLLEGDLKHRENNATILRDPNREELQEALEQADEAHQDANDAIDDLSKMQLEMQKLRKELDQILLKARHALVGAYFMLDGPSLRECLFAYGYRYRGRKKSESKSVEIEEKVVEEVEESAATFSLDQPHHAFSYDPKAVRKMSRSGASSEKDVKKGDGSTRETETSDATFKTAEGDEPVLVGVDTEVPTVRGAEDEKTHHLEEIRTTPPPEQEIAPTAPLEEKPKQGAKASTHKSSSKEDREAKKAKRQMRKKSRR